MTNIVTLVFGPLASALVALWSWIVTVLSALGSLWLSGPVSALAVVSVVALAAWVSVYAVRVYRAGR